MSYERVMTETVTTCLLNPRATWQLSWERIGTWGRLWRRCVQRGDVLISTPVAEAYNPYSVGDGYENEEEEVATAE